MPADVVVRFTLPDPDRVFRHVRLYQELKRPYDGPPMTYDARRRRWQVEVDVKGAQRVEYLFNHQDRDGGWSMEPDPGNGRRAPGPFGDKSVLELPGYRPPAWLAAGTNGHRAIDPLEVPSRRLGRPVPVELWTSPGHDADERLPLLVALDGPELAAYSSLLDLVAQGPPVHVALVAPIDRDDEYSASAAFAHALTNDVLPAIARHRNVPEGPEGRLGLGVSLGGLALLHVHRAQPSSFGALFLQSGSFFQRRTDAHESGFGRYARLTRFVATVLRGDGSTDGSTDGSRRERIPIVLTCGTVEENLANNRAMCVALDRQGYDVRLVEHPDGHNWVSWRDVLDPHLLEMLARLDAGSAT